MPISLSGMFGNATAWNYYNSAPFLQPTYKRYRMGFRGQASSAPSGFLVVSPFFTPLACWWTLIVVLSIISVVSSTKSCSIKAVRISIFPYASFCPDTEPAVHTLPWPEPIRQIPPWYSGVQPIQDGVKHFPVTFSWPPSLRLFFRRKLILDPIPLLFAYFMSFHVLYFIILALCTQYLSFKIGSSLSSFFIITQNVMLCKKFFGRFLMIKLLVNLDYLFRKFLYVDIARIWGFPWHFRYGEKFLYTLMTS
jgi:hypothetical protein